MKKSELYNYLNYMHEVLRAKFDYCLENYGLFGEATLSAAEALKMLNDMRAHIIQIVESEGTDEK